MQLPSINFTFLGVSLYRFVFKKCNTAWKVSVFGLFGSIFSSIRTDYREILRNSPCSFRMRENTVKHNKLVFSRNIISCDKAWKTSEFDKYARSVGVKLILNLISNLYCYLYFLYVIVWYSYTAWKRFVFWVFLVRMREDTDQKNSKYNFCAVKILHILYCLKRTNFLEFYRNLQWKGYSRK